MKRLTRQFVALATAFLVAVTPAYAAAPVQSNPNNALFPGMDNSTGYAATPYIDHATGAMTVLIGGSAASSVPSSVNVSQFGGASTVTGTGVSGSGVPRVTVSSDSTVGLNAGASLIGSVSAVQSTSPWVTLDGSTGIAGASAPAYASVLGGVDSTGNTQKIKASPYAGENALVVDNVANGTPGASQPAQVEVVAGLDSASNVRPVLTSSSGVMYVNSVGLVPTYHAVIADLTPAASATDVTTICGSATKTVAITRIQVTADAASTGVLDFYTFIRTTPDVGGASSVVAVASHDSLNPAATAVVLKYTSNPASLGTGVMFAADHYALPAAASTGYPGVPWVEDLGVRNTQPVILRGTSNCFTFGFNGQTIPASTVVYVTPEWVEYN